ncbi:MAG: arsenite oxidase small subunit [Candidatus Hydrogenedentota bacterium]|nr:MAG: arsenite oxidase small subunit [Candidatus Hydrogenedentota bacterium]
MDMETHQPVQKKVHSEQPACVSRRDFMLFSGAAAVSLATLGLTIDMANGQIPQQVRYKEFPRMLVGKVSQLDGDTPTPFHYPYDHPFCRSLLFKLDSKGGGGVGVGENIVAFNQICTHMGGMLEGQFNPGYKTLGPCPIHLTTFDVARYGMVVSGHATQGLPQIILELDGDEIYATGVMGLMYGHHDNRAGLVEG